MLGVGLVCVFYAEVVNAKGQEYFSASVCEEAGCVSTWYVSICLQVLFQLVVCNAFGLFQAVHAFPDFN